MTDSDQVLELQDADDDKNLTLDEEDTLLDEDDGAEGEDDLQNFLTENKLQEHHHLFKEQQIDFETLLLLTETDLKSLNLPLGPFRKLVTALQKRRDAKGSEEVDGEDKNVSVASVVEEEPKAEEPIKVEEPPVFEMNKIHPYYYDLTNFEYPEHATIKTDLKDPPSLETREYEIIEKERDLKRALNELRKESAIAIAYKASDNDRFQWLLLQISTPSCDYIIDLKLLNNVEILLTDVFINSNIVKVFHDDRIVLRGFQRTQCMHMINSFSVRVAAKSLNYEETTMNALLKKYGAYAKPSSFSCTVRPLSAEIVKDLRMETSFLLHIYYKIKNELIDAGKLDEVLTECHQAECHLVRPYKPDEGFPEDSENTSAVFDIPDLNPVQKQAAQMLGQWRSSVSRIRRVPPSQVLSVTAATTLCQKLPFSKDEILGIVNNHFVRQHVFKISSMMKLVRRNNNISETDESTTAPKSPRAVVKAPLISSTPTKSFQLQQRQQGNKRRAPGGIFQNPHVFQKRGKRFSNSPNTPGQTYTPSKYSPSSAALSNISRIFKTDKSAGINEYFRKSIPGPQPLLQQPITPPSRAGFNSGGKPNRPAWMGSTAYNLSYLQQPKKPEFRTPNSYKPGGFQSSW